jgi:uncharacterized lipoprotein YmbA
VKVKPLVPMGVCAALLLGACASKPDHFYTLNTLPDGERTALSMPLVHIRLDVTVPPLVDRSEMVLSTADNGVLILDHERWAAPLSDQVTQTLGRDIERRRADVLIGDRRFDQQGRVPTLIKVDIVRMSVQRGGRARLEAHWRIVDGSGGTDELGGDFFEAPAGDGYAGIAEAYSRALSELADRLAARLPRPT